MSLVPNEWNGQLDDFRIYRRALTPLEITAIYNPPPPPPYEVWLNGLANPLPAHLRDMDLDPDGDGHSNLMEYALGSHPNNSGDILRPLFQRSGNQLSLSYPRWRPELSYLVETCPDLLSWSTAGVVQDTATPVGQTATATMLVPAESERVFLRLRVE